jgi:hypothetical protein
MAPMYLLCQEGKNSHFLTVNQAENQKPRKLMQGCAAQRSTRACLALTGGSGVVSSEEPDG